MNNSCILNNINILLAKLKPSQYRKYWKIWNKNFRDRYKDIFENKYRIYLDFPENDDALLIPDRESSENIKRINTILKDCPYTKDFIVRNINDYIKGYAYKKADLGDFLEKVKENKDLQKSKIGKLLNKALKYFEKENISPETYMFQETMNKFNTRPSFNQLIQSKLVCISRHPYDITGMSTDRRWKSCMRLGDKEKYIPAGGMQYFIEEDIREGTLVAYLIYEDDKNINDPLARILIKPYINIDDHKDILLIPEPVIYSDDSLGSAEYNKFKKIVDNWLENFQGEKTGVYRFNTNLYRDRSPEKFTKVPKSEIEKLNKLGITVTEYSYDKSLDNIVAKFPWLLDGTFEDLVIHTDESDPQYINIKSGTWKNGIMINAKLEKDFIVEYGILHQCGCAGIFLDGIFYKGYFNGVFQNGIWLGGIFTNTGVWKKGLWKSGLIYLFLPGYKSISQRLVINPNIAQKIAYTCEDESEFISKYKKYKRKIFGSEENVEKHLKSFEKYENKVIKLIEKY